MNKQLAKIKGTSLGFESHDIFTATIDLDYGHCMQSIGGYVMSYSNDNELAPATTKPRAADFITGVLFACGVRRWEDLVGRTIFAIFDGDHMPLNVMPIGIEALPFERGGRFIFKHWQDAVIEAERR